MNAYVGHHLGKLSPHVFAIAEEAFRHMSIDGTNQSILVSGESGAGKTETTKYILRYLAAMASAGSAKEGNRSSLLAQKVLESTPLLEVHDYVPLLFFTHLNQQFCLGVWQCAHPLQQQLQSIWQIHRDLVGHLRS